MARSPSNGDEHGHAQDPLCVAMLDPSMFSPPYDDALCGALTRAGHAVTLYGRRPRPDETKVDSTCVFAPHFYETSERLRRLPAPLAKAAGPVKVVEHATGLAALWRAFRQATPDVIHVQWLVAPCIDRVALEALARIAPIVVTMHNKVPMHGRPRSRVQTVGWRAAVRHADHVIVHTDATRAAMVEAGAAPERVSVVPHGLLPSLAGSGTEGSRDDGAPLEILVFGRVRPYKGVDVFLEAIARIPVTLRRRASFRIVGEPLMPMEPLRSLAERLGVADEVHWELRFVPDDDVAAVFERASVVVFPYRDIDASGVLMKALAHGRPVVATDVGGFGDLLDSGENALLVPPGDATALASAIGRVIEDEHLRERLRTGAAALASNVASWDDIAAQTVSVYRHARARLRRG